MSDLDQAGVYAIVNSVTGDSYIGSTSNFKRRFRQHKASFNRGDHHAKSLQNDWNSQGKDDFQFLILEAIEPTELIDPDYLLDLEQTYLSSSECNYNTYKFSDSARGSVRSEEAKLKTSEALKGKPKTPEHIQAMCKAQKGRKFSEDHLRKAHLAAQEKNSKEWTLYWEETGEEFTFKNLHQFCKDRSLSYRTMRELLTGKRLRNKGWIATKESPRKRGDLKAKTYILTDPDGKEHLVTNLMAFCLEHNLQDSNLHKVRTGKYNHHKGWKCRYA